MGRFSPGKQLTKSRQYYADLWTSTDPRGCNCKPRYRAGRIPAPAGRRGSTDMADRQDRGKRPRRKEASPKELEHRPFKEALKGVKARPPGPACIRCNGPIDSRPGWSLPYSRGSRKHQRHGYLHPDCELEAALEMAKEQGTLMRKQDGTQYVGYGTKLLVPVYTEEELDQMIEEGAVS